MGGVLTPSQFQGLALTGGTVTGNLAVTGSVTAGNAPGGPLQELVATTGVGGFALQNATPTILTWNVPNDGNEHRFIFQGSRAVSVAETGGQLTLTYTPPGGQGAIASIVAGGGSGVGSGSISTNVPVGIAAPGTTVTLAQTSALTAGACQVNAEIWAS